LKYRAFRSPRIHERRTFPLPSMVVAGVALFIALGGTAIAAGSLIHARNIAAGAVTSRTIRNGSIVPKDLSSKTRDLLYGANGKNGIAGTNGTAGTNGANGANGPNGANGVDGTNGADGSNGTNGINGAAGANGANGPNGANGVDGTNGADGTNGTNGTNGINGTIVPLSATKGLTALPTASPPTTVVELTVPAGNYVVLAKTQLSHTGAGDSVECSLKAGAATVDQIAMKTLPALAAIPASLQAVTTVVSPSQLSVQCTVLVANGSANFSSLIAIPTG
jgi:Collagen triple helix repeat (20 copies)